ncbi:HAD-IIB family hydrolase [Pistricoccus aurantiacus]|uniref:sucrose-phosphate synthase n=1 Tax=Pistricoccus aurantiacus TaxID=1883414 RepID=A0A5B8SQQ8_9GAMM|nr:HAD-IIB family hydrolase [Pistricoccus aurantiacus]QEA39479.1 HAD-IIB family hydrolase [Pistricoccus aurantiacus]
MYIMHVALQGCLRGQQVEYGITADTGGHIKYLLELVGASSWDATVQRIDIVTRAFDMPHTASYGRDCETIDDKIRILRFRTPCPDYLPKEALWRELPAFIEALDDYLDTQERKPDVLHAHYADAGKVAMVIKSRHGIPYLFTAHSLGRIKWQACHELHSLLDNDDMKTLARRIECEEEVIERADLIVASSRDEAEVQYAAYDAYDPGKIRIIAPGSDLRCFREASSDARVDEMLNRFLKAPEKPVLLAIARPVSKKNLASLVTAYGESKALQEKANLIVIAGNRKDIATLEGEIRDNLEELLYLIDKYDLYGSVAYPKQHASCDIPAIYAFARKRKGVFVNPAFNEPFGLTLLEASAAGLPVIATDSGGPNDIVERCGNGVLVNPHSPNAIATAALELLSNEPRWQRYAKAGASAVAAYDWQAHVAQYHELIRRGLERIPPRARATSLLISDIDNTLLGSEKAAAAFCRWRNTQVAMGFGVATGRSFHSALNVLEQQGMPSPEVMITSVGSEIYYLEENRVTYRQDHEWARLIGQDWRPQTILDALRDMVELTSQGQMEQRPFKLSYLIKNQPSLATKVRERLASCGLRASVIYSHGRYLDILPPGASKGKAVEHVRRHYGLPKQAVFVAGDSGNDLEMLRTMPCAIIVANFSDDLLDDPTLTHGYFAKASHAQGVIEGVTYFQQHVSTDKSTVDKKVS